MRRTIRFTCDDIRPDGGAIIRRMHGATPGVPYLNDLAEEARTIIDRVGQPSAVFQRIGLEQFESLYCASPANQLPAPLPRIARHAAGIALFAGTLGRGVEAAIRARIGCRPTLHDCGCFSRRGAVEEACMLDAFAAAACERLAQVTADQFAASLPDAAVPAFAYVPGSCGWDQSALAAVLERLRPDELGVWPGETGPCAPLTAVAGVLVAAPASVHRTTAQFPCCATCAVHRCLYRVSATNTAA